MTAGPVQLDVATCPLDGVNVIEASAGTGKTWTICALYLRLLLERGLDVRQILVVTFTNAATAELRERVRARIAEALAALAGPAPPTGDPFVPQLMVTLEGRGIARNRLTELLEQALATFDEAAIFTIHGFCQRALADTPFTAGIPFTLDLLPDDSDLRMEAVHDFWRRHVAGGDFPPELAPYLLDKGDSPEKFARLLQRHLTRPLTRMIWPREIDLPFVSAKAALDLAYSGARATWQAQRADVVDLLLASLPALNAQTYKRQAIENAASAWDAYLHTANPFATIDSDEQLDLLRATRLAACTKKRNVPPTHPFFTQAEALLTARADCESVPRARLIRTMLDQASAGLRERMRERRVVSYQEILYNLYAALHGADNPSLAASLRARFPAALIDEFQDTDPLQFAIFHAIYGAGGNPLFLVGDPKQAIYSFRGADLYTYLSARRSATSAYTLADNQRSTTGLIAAVNGLFATNELAFMLPGLAFYPGRPGAKPPTRLHDATRPSPDLCVWMLPQTSDGGLLDREMAKSVAAAAAAGEIARLLRDAAAGGLTLDDRALRPADIAVLVGRHAEGLAMKEALRALGLGSVERSQQSVFRATDADDVERVLAAILEPARAGLLRSALATELLGCDAAEVAAISANEAEVMARIERFAGYREIWMRDGVGVMFRRLWSAEGVTARMLARPDGERRLTNLLHLAERLHQASAIHAAPDALLRWMQAQRRETAVDDAAQLRLESDRDLVQIVTIHAAKGLEYPVVFCPFLWDGHRAARGSRSEGREYHDASGEAVVDFRGENEVGDEIEAIKQQIRLESSAEALRMMYVALTRASHRCYLIAGCYYAKTSGKPSVKQSTRSLLNWLVAGNGQTPQVWFEGEPSPTDIGEAWRTLARRLDPHLACTPLPLHAGTPITLAQPATSSLRALPPPARIADGWRISSFTGLNDGAVGEAAATDHDARAGNEPFTRALPSGDLPADDILRFPRGTSAGDCLHAALERIDFTDPGTWDAAIGQALRTHPMTLPGLPRSEQRPLLTRMMSRVIADLMGTELPDGIRLQTVSNARRLTELEWSLPSPRLSAKSLNATLLAQHYPMGRLTFPRLEGYLKGFIDLVFEHGGRYYVLDWKSNHLGYTSSDYEAPALASAMTGHGYHLQYLLYSIAVTRYLAQRIPAYRHDVHFGGVLYLFVRGVRPQWKNAQGAATGVYFHRPSAPTLDAFDALLTPMPGVQIA